MKSIANQFKSITSGVLGVLFFVCFIAACGSPEKKAMEGGDEVEAAAPEAEVEEAADEHPSGEHPSGGDEHPAGEHPSGGDEHPSDSTETEN